MTTADIIHEYGPFPNIDCIHGVTHDGQCVWIATGDTLVALDPENGQPLRSLEAPANAGTAFDGHVLFQIAGDRILKIDPRDARVLATIPAPTDGGNSGMAWAEGSLWVGQHKGRKIHRVDPETGDILSTIESDRFVTGITWSDGELWHGTWEDDKSDIRRIDPQSGDVRERLEMPAGKGVSGLECDTSGRFFCGGGDSGTLRVVRRPEAT